MSKKEVPIWEKSNLTLEEAAAYFGIGVNKLRELTDETPADVNDWQAVLFPHIFRRDMEKPGWIWYNQKYHIRRFPERRVDSNV